MTNKQIIIDGVDVSGCEVLTKTEHCKAQMPIMGTDTNKCKCFPNCYYKQLKRKEQECERLKAENEELKQRLHQCWTIENSFVEQLDQLEAENKQAEQKLERIREICKPYLLFRGYSGQCVNTNEFAKLCKELAKDILQIISEVEDDRQN